MSRSLIDSPFMVLVRRELWEHRSLIWAPLAMALAIIVLSVVSGMMHGGIDIRIDGDQPLPTLLREAEQQRGLFGLLIGGLMLPQMLVGSVVVFFYLLDCLFTERRDRSILFWKSLPVSDAKTVLSKLFVALVAMPLWIWALSLVVGLVVFGVVAAKVAGTPAAALGTWHGGTWLAVQGTLLGEILLGVLWYLPMVGWLVLVSSLAKRAPLIWATLPFLMVSIAESTALGTRHVAELLERRFEGWADHFSFGGSLSLSNAQFKLLTSAELWLGVLVGAALVYAAIRVRRRSDDS